MPQCLPQPPKSNTTWLACIYILHLVSDTSIAAKFVTTSTAITENNYFTQPWTDAIPGRYITCDEPKLTFYKHQGHLGDPAGIVNNRSSPRRC